LAPENFQVVPVGGIKVFISREYLATAGTIKIALFKWKGVANLLVARLV